MRPLGYLSPTMRSTRSAAAQLLAVPATAGFWGCLADLQRVALATKVTGSAVIGLVVVVPPAVSLAVQLACWALAAHSQGYCTTQVRPLCA